MFASDRKALSKATTVSSVSGGSLASIFAARNFSANADPRANREKAYDLGYYLANRSLRPRATLIFDPIDIPLVVLPIALVLGVSNRYWPSNGLAIGIAIALSLFILAIALYATFTGNNSIVPSKIEKMNRYDRSLSLTDRLRQVASRYRSVASWVAFGRKFCLYLWNYYTFRVFEAKRQLIGQYETLSSLSDSSFVPVLCTTDLGNSTHIYISPKFAAAASRGSFDGRGRPKYGISGWAGSMPVAKAAMASAAFPGAFQPIRLDSDDFGFPSYTGQTSRYMRLADGGLYDNLGFSFYEMWMTDSFSRETRADFPKPSPKQILVVDAGLVKYEEATGGLFRSFARSFGIVHAVQTYLHRRRFLDFLELANGEAGDDAGTLVSISDSPWQLVDDAPQSDESVVKLRTLLEQIEHENKALTSCWWTAQAQNHSPAVPTDLRRLGEKRAAHLVYHAYMVTLVRCCLDLGWEVPDIKDIPKLDDLRKEFRSRSLVSRIYRWWCSIGAGTEESVTTEAADVDKADAPGSVAEEEAATEEVVEKPGVEVPIGDV
jgi:hypothetical protein